MDAAITDDQHEIELALLKRCNDKAVGGAG